MKTDRNIFRLKHILESVEKILFITKKVLYKKFEEDWIIQDVVIRNLEIIGEAANHIDEDLREKFPEIQWNEIRGLRNLIAHVYFNIDTLQIWETVQNNIPELKESIQNILKNLEK